MNVTTRASGNFRILELHGTLVFGSDTIELRNAVHEAARSHPQKLILNLAHVTYVDSCGIGELVSTYSHVSSQGGSVVLTDLPERVRKLLAIAQLTPIFRIFGSEKEAIADSRRDMSLCRMCG